MRPLVCGRDVKHFLAGEIVTAPELYGICSRLIDGAVGADDREPAIRRRQLARGMLGEGPGLLLEPARQVEAVAIGALTVIGQHRQRPT